VVGVLTRDGQTCQVLVYERGKPVSGIRVVSVSTYDPKSAAYVNFAKSGQQAAQPTLHRARSSKPATTGTTGTTTLTAEQNQELVKYGLILIGICIVARECWPLRRWRACTLSYFFRSNCMASKPVRGWTPFTPRRN
jgi:hypothetical protein